MAENSKIEWTDHTFNPWIGCTKISPGCDRCYALEMMEKRYKRVKWGAGEKRVRTSPANWKGPYRWNRQAGADGVRRTVFCASLADVFDNEVDPQWRADLFMTIASTQNLTWLLLTKRIGNVMKMVEQHWGPGVPPNTAIGATMVNQEEYDRDRMKLAEVHVKLRPRFTFASIEPMIGPIILDNNAPNWIICGGESGAKPRHMEHQWARDLRDGARRFDRKFFMKQMTGKAPIPADLLVRQFPQ